VRAAAIIAAACTPDRAAPNANRVADEVTSYAVQRAALDSLFMGREHHERLVLWSTDAGDGPVLETLGPALVRSRTPRTIDVGRLRARLPARVVTEAQIAELFRRHPDAWAAFFRENPGAAGLVELAPVRRAADGRTAQTYVARSCGEHCRSAWDVTARRDTTGAWRITDIRVVRLPPA